MQVPSLSLGLHALGLMYNSLSGTTPEVSELMAALSEL